jgi:L,D-peptidoglycan transpeptidase YkuD (ErfK/YbiS/YcfS/YnhG family)
MRPIGIGAALLGAVGAMHAGGAGAQGAANLRTTPVPASARQLVLVVTAGWDSTAGVLRRFRRDGAGGPWLAEGSAVPVVVGRAGLGWAGDSLAATGDPRKREGDGRAPAGVLPLDEAFGFAPKSAMAWAQLPYVQLTEGSECVDDTASAHYNTIVDRARIASIDWSSSERMREIGQYAVGVVVGYNSRPAVPGRGSCIFLHIWGGPGSSTAGCTAMPRPAVESLLLWLDPRRRPVMVQLPAVEYARLRRSWQLP